MSSILSSSHPDSSRPNSIQHYLGLAWTSDKARSSAQISYWLKLTISNTAGIVVSPLMADLPPSQTPEEDLLSASETLQPQPQPQTHASSSPPSPSGSNTLKAHPASPVLPALPSPTPDQEPGTPLSSPSLPILTEDELPSGSLLQNARPDKGKAPLRHDPRDISTLGETGDTGPTDRTGLQNYLSDYQVDTDDWSSWCSSSHHGVKVRPGSSSRYPLREAIDIGHVASQNDVAGSVDTGVRSQRAGQTTLLTNPVPAGDTVTGEAGEFLTTSMTSESSLEVDLSRSFTPLKIGDPGWETDPGRPPTKLPLRFRDGVGRVYIFPWEFANTWQKMRGLIDACFAYGSPRSTDVLAGRFDLFATFRSPQVNVRETSSTTVSDVSVPGHFSGLPPTTSSLGTVFTADTSNPNGTGERAQVEPDTLPNRFRLLPELWDMLIEPGMSITQVLWPPPVPAHAPAINMAPPPPPPPQPMPIPIPATMPGMHGAIPPGHGGRGAVGPGWGRGRGRGGGAGPMPVPIGPPGITLLPARPRPAVRIIVMQRPKTRRRRA